MERLGERRLGVTEAVAQTLAIGPVVSVGFAAYLSVTLRKLEVRSRTEFAALLAASQERLAG